MASWLKRVYNKLTGRKTEDEAPKKTGGTVRYSGGTGGGGGATASSNGDWFTNPANPLSPLSPLNPAFNDASSGTGSTHHAAPSCDPAPSTHHSTSHCAPDTSTYHHTPSHDTTTYTHHDTSSYTSHDFGGGFSHHH